MVRREQARFALAGRTDAVRDVGVGDHAATDAGGDRQTVLFAVDGGFSHGARPGASRRRDRPETVGGIGLLQPGEEPVKSGENGLRRIRRRTPPRQKRTAKTPRDRRVHGGGDPVDRLRGKGTRRGRQRASGGVPADGGPLRRDRRQGPREGGGRAPTADAGQNVRFYAGDVRDRSARVSARRGLSLRDLSVAPVLRGVSTQRTGRFSSQTDEKGEKRGGSHRLRPTIRREVRFAQTPGQGAPRRTVRTPQRQGDFARRGRRKKIPGRRQRTPPRHPYFYPRFVAYDGIRCRFVVAAFGGRSVLRHGGGDRKKILFAVGVFGVQKALSIIFRQKKKNFPDKIPLSDLITVRETEKVAREVVL